MPLAHHHLVIQDESGNVVNGASVEVRLQLAPGQPLGVPYSDRAGTISLGNPYVAADGADAGFYILGGMYQVRAYLGASGAPTFERFWYDVAIGTAASHDAEDFLTPLDIEAFTPAVNTSFSRCRVVSTGAASPTGAFEDGDVIDGVTLVTGDLVLRASSTSPELNGVWVVPASGAASRHVDFATYNSVVGVYFSVLEGDTYADTLWRCISNFGGTLGTTALSIIQFEPADIISVTDFGVTLDGLNGAANLSAFQAAINYCQTNLKTLRINSVIASAVIAVAGTLSITSPIRMIGDGAHGVTIMGEGLSTDQYVLDIDGTVYGTFARAEIGGFTIMSDNLAPDLIHFKNASESKLFDIGLRSARHGIVYEGTRAFSNYFERVTVITGLSGRSVWFNGHTGGGHHTFQHCSLSGDYGIYISANSLIDNVTLTAVNFEQCVTNGMRVDGSVYGLNLLSCRTEGGDAADIIIRPFASDNFVVGLNIIGCSFNSSDNGGVSRIILGGDSGKVRGFNINGNSVTHGTHSYSASFVTLNGDGESGVIANNWLDGTLALCSPVNTLRPHVAVFNNEANDGQFPSSLAIGDFLSAGNNLSDVSSIGTSRTNLGIGIGDSPRFAAINLGDDSDTTLTRVSAGVASIEGSNILLASGLGSITQAYDVKLAALVGLTWAADKAPYFTGAGAAALADFTAAGRAMVAAASATAQTALLNAFIGDSGAGGVKGVVPAPAAGDAAAGKFLKADGTFSAPSGSGAPSDADYLVKTANGSLSAERVITDTASVIWDWATGGQAKATVPAASTTVAGVQDNAIQSEMEAGTGGHTVTPDVQHFHPSAAKMWAQFNIAGAVAASYNLTSVTDGGVGVLDPVIGTDFSNTAWVCTCLNGRQVATAIPVVPNVYQISAGGIGLIFRLSTTGVAADPDNPDLILIAGFGDQ